MEKEVKKEKEEEDMDDADFVPAPVMERDGQRKSGRKAEKVKKEIKKEVKEKEKDGQRKSGRKAEKVKKEIKKEVKEIEKEDGDDEDFVPSPVKSPVTKGKSVTPTKGEKSRRKSGVVVEARDSWAEVPLPSLGRWVAVDLLNGLVD